VAEYLISRNALDGAALERIRDGFLASPLVGRSTLAGAFRGSYGLAVTFTAPGRAELISRYPELAAALDALAAPPAFGAAPNAWYLNLLALPPGRGVGRHTDGTLRQPAEEPDALPLCVSVLYLLAPAGSSALQLFEADACVAELPPEEGAVVHFAGALEHAVAPSAAERKSLVLEQYRLSDEALARIPSFKLDSRAGFAAHLRDHAARPGKKLDLE
jgi:hypothetical protein